MLDRPNNRRWRTLETAGGFVQFPVPLSASAAASEIRAFEAVVQCRASLAFLDLGFKGGNAGGKPICLESFCIAIQDVHQLAGLLGGELAIVNRSGERGH